MSHSKLLERENELNKIKKEKGARSEHKYENKKYQILEANYSWH